MAGLIYTLEQDRKDPRRQNVEWFDRSEINIDGEKFTIRTYLFKKTEKRDQPTKSGKKDKKKNPAENYRSDEGVLFTYNGQCQHVITKDFFRRPRVNQDYLYNSLLVFVDCALIGVRAHEKLFMANRENLRQGSLKVRLIRELESLIHESKELERRADARRKGELSDNPQTTKTFEKFIENMVKRHPVLEQILGPGFRIANPFKPHLVETQEKPWEGKRFPTRFHFKGLDPGKPHTRDAHLDSKIRIPFDTDAEDDYFRRDDEQGEFKLYQIVNGERIPAKNWTNPPNLFEGAATLTITSLPPDAEKGDILTYEAEISDPSRLEPFLNRLTLVVKERRKTGSGGKSSKKRKKAASDKEGKDTANDTQLNIPDPNEVIEETWKEHEPEFDRMTAMRVKRAPTATENLNIFDYFINMDNVFLNQAVKAQPRRTKELRDRFKFGMTIISLALIRHDVEKRSLNPINDEDEADGKAPLPVVQDIVGDVTTAIAPFFLPLVDALSGITGFEPLSASAGEAA
jgi:hypothetical protein